MEYFTNPYNFVPFTGTCQREPLNLGPQECMTGYFECELELLNPLISLPGITGSLGPVFPGWVFPERSS